MSTSHQFHNEDERYWNMGSNNEQSKFLELKKLKIFYFISILSLIFCFVLLAITIALYSKTSVSSLDIEQSEKIQSVVNESRVAQHRIDNSRKDNLAIRQQYEALQNETSSLRARVQNISVGVESVLQNYKKLQDDFNSMSEELLRFKNETVNEQVDPSTYKRLPGGWITFFNGYQYKATNTTQSWYKSRQNCQNWGGDLAVYGIQNMEFRRILMQKFSVRGRIWIGLKKISGQWKWVNGQIASPSSVFWGPGQPSTYNPYDSSEECVEIITYERSGRTFGNCGNDHVCSISQRALCEKAYQQA